MEHASLLWKGVSPLRKGLSNKILIIKPDYATLRRMEEERAGAGERQVLQQCETGALQMGLLLLSISSNETTCVIFRRIWLCDSMPSWGAALGFTV